MIRKIGCFLLFIMCGLFIMPMNNAFKVNAAEESKERITVVNNEFQTGSGRIWINGANTPWNKWNDFGGGFDYTWWDNHFKELNKNGINATRVWITCNGDVGINIDGKGIVSGATDKHWSDLDKLFEIARNNKVYIMATLISFDHFKDSNANYMKWRSMIQSSEGIDSYVKNYVVPFVNRYKDNPYLWSIDLCNEPDWIFENKECGNISWDHITEYFAKAAAAIHENSSILVTVGIAMVKYNSDSLNGNMVSDERLQKIANNKLAKVDFYSPHHYPWMDQWFKIPFNITPVEYKLDGTKPALLGECSGLGSANGNLTQDLVNAFNNGWQGVMPWTSNGVDSNGSMVNLAPASNNMLKNYEKLIYPNGGHVSAPEPQASSTPKASPAAEKSVVKADVKKVQSTSNKSIPVAALAIVLILAAGGITVYAVRHKK